MTLIFEIAAGIVLGAFLLWAVFAVGHAISNYQPRARQPEYEPTALLMSIGGMTECIFAKDKGEHHCCRNMVYNPAFANTLRKFATYEDARTWAKEMVNVDISERMESDRDKYWHGNLEVFEVPVSALNAWFDYRTPDGKVDPQFQAETQARLKAADEMKAAEDVAHVARMKARMQSDERGAK